MKKTYILIVILFIYNLSIGQTYLDYYNNGNAKNIAKDYIGAINEYNKAIELNQNHFESYLYRGHSKLNLEKPEEALLDFNKAIKLNPFVEDAYYNRAISKSMLKDYNGAILDFNKCIEFNPNNSEFYLYRGINKLYVKDYNNALIDINKSIKIDSLYAKSYYYRGLVNSELKNYDNACKDIIKSKDLGYPMANQLVENPDFNSMCNSTKSFTQSTINDQTLIGSWKVNKVEINDTELLSKRKNELEMVVKVLSKMKFHFYSNKIVTVEAPDKSLGIQNGQWKIDKTSSKVVIQEKKEKGKPTSILMSIYVEEKNNKIYFLMEETPVILEVEKITK